MTGTKLGPFTLLDKWDGGSMGGVCKLAVA